MSTISLCMIVKNEKDTIARCLNSVKSLVDEIIIVDTGSTDNTKELCKKYTDLIFDFDWCDDFSKARNYSFSKATCDYILWLDADDVVPLKSLKKLKTLKENLTADTYMLKYDVAFYNNTPTFSFYRERILKNCNLAKWQGCVHECITPFGKIERINISIEHKKLHYNQTNRNLKIYENLIKKRALNPREKYYYGRELYDHKKYKKCIKILDKFVEEKQGWIENIIDACYLISQCYHQLNNTEKELEYLLKTFLYDTPRNKTMCKIGDYFLNLKQYELSKYWYLLSINTNLDKQNNGFVEKIYFDYYPYLQLCICYYNLGDIEKAINYNLKAHKCMPTNTTINNINFFENLKEKRK